MKVSKRRKLKAAGWSVGTAELSEDESRQVTESMPQAPRADDLRIPDGWTLEPFARQPDYALLSTPSPGRYIATIDFRARGIRSGYSISGKFVGEEWSRASTARASSKRARQPRGSKPSTTPMKYSGRGWKQTLVEAAIAHLQEVLR